MAGETKTARAIARPVPASGDQVHDRIDPFAAGLLVTLCLAWGLNHVSMKIANDGLQPVFQSGLRFALGTIVVFAWCRFRRIALFERDGTLWWGLLIGAIFGTELAMLNVGLDYTTASRGVVFLYVMPFVVAVGAHFFVPGERMTWIGFGGLVLAFVGVVIAFSDKLSLPSPEAVYGDLICLAAGTIWGIGTLIIKLTPLRYARAEKLLIYQTAVSAVILLPIAPAFGPLVRDITPMVVVAFTYQVLGVVAVSFLAWFWLIRHYPAGRLSSFTFLTPMFGVLFGGVLLGEPVSSRLGLALLLVAAGIYLVNAPRPKPAAPG